MSALRSTDVVIVILIAILYRDGYRSYPYDRLIGPTERELHGTACERRAQLRGSAHVAPRPARARASAMVQKRTHSNVKWFVRLCEAVVGSVSGERRDEGRHGQRDRHGQKIHGRPMLCVIAGPIACRRHTP